MKPVARRSASVVSRTSGRSLAAAMARSLGACRVAAACDGLHRKSTGGGAWPDGSRSLQTSDCAARWRRYCAVQQQRDREAMTAAASASRIVEKTGQPSFDRCQEAVAAAERLLHLARAGVRKAVEAAGGI